MITTGLHVGLIRAALATAVVSIFAVSSASASPQYPVELRTALNLYYTPSCTLCHSTVSGSTVGPVDTPFGKSMVARGLRGEAARDGGVDADGGTVDPTLLAALAAMRKDGVDSDGDGAEDLDELSWEGDPNHYDGLRPNDIPQVNYGCQIARNSGAEGNLFATLLGLVLVAARRRR